MRVRRLLSSCLSITVAITQLALPIGKALASLPEPMEGIPQPRPSPPTPVNHEPIVIPVIDSTDSTDDETTPRASTPARPAVPPGAIVDSPTPLALQEVMTIPLGTGNSNYGQAQRDTDNPQNHPGHHFAGPVNLLNGNFFLTVGDFFVPGRGLSLQLARSYNSLAAVQGVIQTFLSETFETFPPPGWSIVEHIGSCAWESTAFIGVPNRTGGPGEAATADAMVCGAPMDTELWTPVLDLSGVSEATLAFRTDFDSDGPAPAWGYVDISTNGGVDWTTLLGYNGVAMPGPRQEVIDLTPYVGSSNTVVRFHFISPEAYWWWQVDDVEIYGGGAGGYVSSFGPGWTHSYETHVISETGGLTVTVREADGALHDYHSPSPCLDVQATCYDSPPGLHRQLRVIPGLGYQVIHKNGTVQQFEPDGRLVEIVDRYNNHINLYYGNCGAGVTTLCEVFGPSGFRSLDFTYMPGPPGPRITQVRETMFPGGRTINYMYDGMGRLIDVAYPERLLVTADPTYVYDDWNRMTSYNDIRQPEGVRQAELIEYDAQDRVVTTTYYIDSFFDVFFAIDYDPPPRGDGFLSDPEQYPVGAVEITDGEGGLTRVEYDAHGNVTYEGDFFFDFGWWWGKWWWWHPYDWWLLERKVDANLHETHYEYDSWGDTTVVTNALTATQRFLWEKPHYETGGATFGNVLSTTNSLGVTTLYDHIYDPTIGDTLRERQAFGTPDESVTIYQNDRFGQLVFQVDNAGQATAYGYDQFGNTTVITDARGSVTRNEFDELGRPITTTDQAGNPTAYVYDEADRLLSVTDAAGNVTSYTYSPDGRDNLVQLVNANGVTTTFEYDALDRLIAEMNSPLQATTYQYDNLNRLIQRTDADGRWTDYEYDAKSRMTKAEYYEVDAVDPYQTSEYRYDGAGNLVWTANEHVRLAYTYDELDQRTQIDMWTPVWGLTRTLQLDRDPLAGNLTLVSGPGGYTVEYTYDYRNRVQTVLDGSGLTTYQYDLDGRVWQVDYPDGTTNNRLYNGTNHLTRLAYNLSTGETISYTYKYDSQGNLTGEVDQDDVYTYDYDAVGRVITATGGTQGPVSFEYDGAGNRLLARGPVSDTKFTYDEHNRLLQAGDATFTNNEMGARTEVQMGSLTYQAAAPSPVGATGGMQATAASTITYQYDNDMRLTDVDPGLTFLYDPLGNLIGTVDATGYYRYFLRDGEDIYVELDGSGNVLAHYTIGGQGVLGMWRDGSHYLFLYDGRGRVRQVIDPFTFEVVVRYGTDLSDPGTGPYYLYNPIRIHGAWWFPNVHLVLFGGGVFWDPRWGVFLIKAWPWLYWPFGPFHPWRPIFRFWPWPWPWARPWGWPWPRPWPFLWPWPGAWVRPWVIWPVWPWGLRFWWPWWYWRWWWGWFWWGRWWCWHPWWWWCKWWWWPWWHPWWWCGYWWWPWWWWWSCWWWPWYWWWWHWWWWPWWWGGWFWWCWWWWWPWYYWWWWPWMWPPILGPPEVGDAPDPPYPSYRRNWGAVHGMWWYEWLGAWRDGEWDSDQIDADRYDDGVSVDPVAGTLTFTPTVASPWSARYGPWGPLNVHGWVDWNSDGDWDDPGEFVVNWSGYPGDGIWPAGLTSFGVVQPFIIPGTVFNSGDVVDLWLRFRLDYKHNLENPRGYTRFGEVEDHKLTVVRSYGVDLTPATAQDSGNNGDTVVYTFTVQNTGNASDSFSLAVADDDWPTGLSASSVGPLDPNVAATFQVSVTVPGASVAYTFDRATVTAQSVASATVSASSTLTTTVLAHYAMRLEPPALSQMDNPSKTVTYTLTIHNDGNVTDTYDTTHTFALWPTSLSTDTVGPIAPWDNESFQVYVTISGSAISGTRDVVTVAAMSQGTLGMGDYSTLTTIATTQTITRGVAISPHVATGSGDPGATVTYTLHVTNTGNVTDVIGLSHTGPATWTVAYSANPLNLMAGSQTSVDVCVGIPASAAMGSSGVVTITVTSQGDPSQTDAAVLTTDVLSKYFIYLPVVMRNHPP